MSPPDDPIVHQPVVGDDHQADGQYESDLADCGGVGDKESRHTHEQELQHDGAYRGEVELNQIADKSFFTGNTI